MAFVTARTKGAGADLVDRPLYMDRIKEDTIYVQVATTIAASAETLSLDPFAGDKSGDIQHLRIPDFLLLDAY